MNTKQTEIGLDMSSDNSPGDDESKIDEYARMELWIQQTECLGNMKWMEMGVGTAGFN